MSLKKVLVFTDFTSASSVAAQHSYLLASEANAEVLSLHTITSDEDKEWAEKKSADQMSRLDTYDQSIPYTPLALPQNLFQGMNAWLAENHIDLACMATHGKKDLQFITGSNALKLIFNAELPFLVVQQHTFIRPYSKIVLPVFGHYMDMKIPFEFLKNMAHLFHAKITLITPAGGDNKEQEALEKVVAVFTASLKTEGITVESKQSKLTERKFVSAVMAEAKEQNADLIAVVVGAKHHREEAEKSKKFYQSMITNEDGIPVLCL